MKNKQNFKLKNFKRLIIKTKNNMLKLTCLKQM